MCTVSFRSCVRMSMYLRQSCSRSTRRWLSTHLPNRYQRSGWGSTESPVGRRGYSRRCRGDQESVQSWPSWPAPRNVELSVSCFVLHDYKATHRLDTLAALYGSGVALIDGSDRRSRSGHRDRRGHGGGRGRGRPTLDIIQSGSGGGGRKESEGKKRVEENDRDTGEHVWFCDRLRGA